MTRIGDSDAKRHGQLHPVLVMFAVMLSTVILTHLVSAGRFQRLEGKVVTSSYQLLPQVNGVSALLSPTAPAQTDSPARAAGVVALFVHILAGMAKSTNVIFMVTFAGGMFGVFRATGAIDAGVDCLLQFAYLLTTGPMLLFLAVSNVSYLEWVRFVAPLFVVLVILGFATLYLIVGLGHLTQQAGFINHLRGVPDANKTCPNAPRA